MECPCGAVVADRGQWTGDQPANGVARAQAETTQQVRGARGGHPFILPRKADPDKLSGVTLQEDDVAGGRDARSEAAASVRWFVITSTLEGLADSLSRTLLPIVAIITLGAGTGLVGVINSLGLIAFLLLGLPIGILADRADTPRRIMTASTLVRAGVAAGALACWGIGWLHGIPG